MRLKGKELNRHMALFLSTFTNKVDRKGRVSVPASFRASLADQAFQGVVLFRSNNHACLEGFGYDAMADLASRMDRFDMFSADQDDMATAIFGEAALLPFDGDGRIILPQDLTGFCAIDESASFVGLGRKFQIWAPERFVARRADARRNVKDKGLTLPKAGEEGA